MSVESRQEKSQHPDYAEADLSPNPNTLYRIETETDVTAVHGVGAEMRPMNCVYWKQCDFYINLTT